MPQATSQIAAAAAAIGKRSRNPSGRSPPSQFVTMRSGSRASSQKMPRTSGSPVSGWTAEVNRQEKNTIA